MKDNDPLTPALLSLPDFEAGPERDLAQAIDRYCDDCRGRVPTFVNQTLGWRGAARLNREALGWDLIRVPLNITWAPFWLLLQLFAFGIRCLGGVRLSAWLSGIPAGLTTQVQKQLGARVEAELLKIEADGPDPVLRYMLQGDRNQPLDWERVMAQEISHKGREQFRSRLFGARTAVAEITTNISMAAVGAVLFNKFTPGALGGGAAFAAWYSWNQAVSTFWAGDTLGRIWYGWFPPETDWTVQWLSTLGLMLTLAFVASLSGFVTDPIQKMLGLHQRRLNKLIEQMRTELKTQLLGNQSTREQFLARVTDVLDWLAIAGRGV